jgi:hypothetical protein
MTVTVDTVPTAAELEEQKKKDNAVNAAIDVAVLVKSVDYKVRVVPKSSTGAYGALVLRTPPGPKTQAQKDAAALIAKATTEDEETKAKEATEKADKDAADAEGAWTEVQKSDAKKQADARTTTLAEFAIEGTAWSVQVNVPTGEKGVAILGLTIKELAVKVDKGRGTRLDKVQHAALRKQQKDDEATAVKATPDGKAAELEDKEEDESPEPIVESSATG